MKSSNKPTSGTILRTRFYPHRLGPTLVQRRRLLELMEASSDVPLTLVAAPAGYGKSILVSQWCELHDGPVGWLSLSEDNSDIRSFLEYFVTALDSVSTEICQNTRNSLLAPKLPTISELASDLLNDLDCINTHCALVLDDYQRIEAVSPVHELIGLLLKYPPKMFHLVIATRRDPPLNLTILRAENRINEVRLLDLRFTRSETREFIALATRLSVENPVVDRLQSKVEGWAAGLQLAALAARREFAPEKFLSNLGGNSIATQEYLVREVLNAQSPKLRNCLIMSAIFDRFCGSLIDAVFANGFAQPSKAVTASDFLESLQRESLFLIPLDSDSEWYRFHHLFREMLNDELHQAFGPGQIKSLHRKASEWFEAKELIAEALEHALAAEDSQHAAQIISKRVHTLISEGNWNLLEQWLNLLPLEARSAAPLLLLGEAFINYRNMNLTAVPPLLDRIDDLMGGKDKEHELSAEIAAFRAYGALLDHEFQQALRILDRADCVQSIPTDHPTLALTEILYALAGQAAGQGKRIRQELKDVLQDESSCIEPFRETNLAQIQVFLSYIEADSKGVGPMLRHARNVAEPEALRNMIPWTEYLDGLIHLQQGHLRSAIPFLRKATDYRYFHHVIGAVNGMCALAVCYQFLGLTEKADNTVQSLERFVIGHEPPLDVFVDCCKARLSLLSGEGANATYWIENAKPSMKEMMFFWFEIPGITYCRVLIASGSEEDVKQAATTLDAYVSECESQHNTCHLIEVYALQALAYERQGNTVQSRVAIDRALVLARDGLYIFAFLEPGQRMIDLLEKVEGKNKKFAQYIISVFSNLIAPEIGVRPVGDQQKALVETTTQMGDEILTEPLTRREQDVLGLLVKRLQDKEIAIELGIAPSTVKGHLKQIFEKLQIHDRRHAARQAARYGYLT